MPTPMQSSPSLAPTLSALTASVGLFFSTTHATAEVIDFSASASGGSNWSNNANWIGGVAPANDTTTDIARFNQTSYANQPNAGSSRSIHGIQIGDGTTNTAALTLAGSSLTLGAGGIDMAANAGTASISPTTITLAANQSWSNGSANLLTVAGTISGAFAIEQNGTGIIQFNQSNNLFTGGYTLNSGTVYLNRDTSGGSGVTAGYTTESLGTGTVTLNGGVVGSTSSQRYLLNAITLNGDVQLGVAAKAGAVLLGGAVHIAGDSQLTLVNGGGGLYANTVTLDGDLTIHTDMAYASGALGVESSSDIVDGASAHGIVKTGSGVHVLAGDNSYSGGTTINAGALWAGSASAFGTGVVHMNGGTLDLRNFALVTNAIDGTSGTLTNTAGSATTVLTVGQGGGSGNFGGNVTQAGSTKIIAVTKTGAGTQIFSGVNAYTGNTIVAEGTMQFAKRASLYNGGAAAAWSATNIVVESGATLAFNLGGAGEFTESDVNALLALSTAAGGLKDGSSLGLDTTNAGGGFTFNSVLGDTNGGANSVGLVKLGSGTLAFVETLAFTGDIRVEGGTLSFQNASVADAASVFISSGAFFDLDYFGSDTISSLWLAGEGTAAGTYGRIGSGADFESAFFTGDGLLNVLVSTAAIPEPSALGLAGGLLALAGAASRRRRAA